MSGTQAEEIARLGSELAVSVFRTWRRDLDCLDALILLVIARSNVDGILYDRQLRTRFGGGAPIAPDHMRQPVSGDVVAMSLRLPASVVRKRTLELAGRGECEIAPNGMIIAQHQLEATNRTAIVTAVYDHVRTAYVRLRDTGFFVTRPVPDPDAGSERQVRTVAAHAAKYLLRLLSAAGRYVGDPRDALLMLHRLARSSEGARSAAQSAASELGLSPNEARRRISRLTVTANYEDPFSAAWCAVLANLNLDYLFQLLAALEEVGALARFERG